MYLLIGFNHYDFKDQKDGHQVVGNNLHLIFDKPDNPYFKGRETIKIGIKDDKLSQFLNGRTIDDVLDTTVDIIYGPHNKILGVVSVN